MIEQFYTTEGAISFIVPFSFVPDNKCDKNKCTKIFNEIKSNNQYQAKKNELVNIIKAYAKQNEYKELTKASECYCGSVEKYCDQNFVRGCIYGEYEGRNLCRCFSISRHFHEDLSQYIPRIEIYLGTYKIRYVAENPNNFFEFYVDALLLLSNETKGECGYVIYNINLKSINENCVGTGTKNKLDNLIFLKHLFYKDNLKCIINDQSDSKVSIQEWAVRYIQHLLSALDLDFANSVNKYVRNGAPFRYSITELDNITDSSTVVLEKVDNILEKYKNQIYGLLVSDEGWRYISEEELEHKFNNNCWSSRIFTNAIFLDHNALVINQYNSDSQRNYAIDAKQWYENYHAKTFNYSEYVTLRPCIPGVASLTFFAFLKAIYKEMMIARAKEKTDQENVTEEYKYNELAQALQQHSMSLDEIRDLEDCISSQFGIPAEIKELRHSYQREANNVHQNKVVNLTHVTAWISLSALVVAVLALGLTDGENVLMRFKFPTIVILCVSVVFAFANYFVIRYYGSWSNVFRKKRNK